MYIFCVL